MKSSAKLEKIKQDYNTIPIPANLKARVKQGIAQAKKEAEEQKAFYQRPIFWTKFSGCVAAAMAAFVLLTNFNAPIAHAMSNIPVLGSIVKVVSFRTFEDSQKDMTAKVNIPEVKVENASGKTDEAATKELNDQVKEYTDQIIQQYKADVKATGGDGKEELTTDYKVVTDNSHLFSLKMDTVVALNTSDVTTKIYHVDKVSGKMITIQDIFQKDSNYLAILTKEVKRQMREQMAADDNISYFIDDTDMPELNWKGLTKDANFYFNKQGEFILAFDKYEVAPGYMGALEFTIPADVIRDIMKPEYLQ